MSLPYMPLYVADYMTKAGHLPTLAHGAYMLLIMNYWQRQGPIPCDDFTLQGITKLSDADWEKLRPHLAAFFDERNGKWHHDRVDEEIEKASAKIELARSKGRRSAQQRLNNSSATAEPQIEVSSTSKGNVETTTLLSSDEESSGSSCASATTTTTNLNSENRETIDAAEVRRRCVEAIGRDFEKGFGSIVEIVRSGVDFEGRVLPLLQSLRGDAKINSWRYAAKIIEDPHRHPPPPRKSQVFVAVGTPAWIAWEKFRGKSPPIAKNQSGNGEGWWFPSQFPSPDYREAAE